MLKYYSHILECSHIIIYKLLYADCSIREYQSSVLYTDCSIRDYRSNVLLFIMPAYLTMANRAACMFKPGKTSRSVITASVYILNNKYKVVSNLQVTGRHIFQFILPVNY